MKWVKFYPFWQHMRLSEQATEMLLWDHDPELLEDAYDAVNPVLHKLRERLSKDDYSDLEQAVNYAIGEAAQHGIAFRDNPAAFVLVERDERDQVVA